MKTSRARKFGTLALNVGLCVGAACLGVSVITFILYVVRFYAPQIP